MKTGIGQSKYCIPQPFSHCLISLCRSLFDFNSIKEIFSVKSERVNGEKKNAVLKKNSMSRAESKEAGQKARPKAGQGCGKLVSVDWLTNSSPAPSLYNRSHICLPIFNYGISKGTGPMLKTKEKKKFLNVFTTFLGERREKRETTYIYPTLE